MYFMLACHFFFFLPNYHFPFFFSCFTRVIFFYAAPSPHSPASKLTTSQLTGMLSKNLLFSLCRQADLFATQGGKAEPKRA